MTKSTWQTSPTGMDLRPYRGTLVAPYYKYKPSEFGYGFIGGSYSVEIMGCPWTCNKCWSGFGHRGRPPAYEFTPGQVVGVMMRGMERNGQQAARLTGGEPTLWWDHLVALIGEFIDATARKVLHIPGETGRRGVEMHLVIETNGSLTSLKRIDELQAQFGSATRRVYLHFGLKATSPEALSDLNGMPIKAAQAAHRRQLECLMHVAANTEFDIGVSFIDRYTEPERYAALEAKLTELRPPSGPGGRPPEVGILRFVSYTRTDRFYVPKRNRETTGTQQGLDVVED